MSIKQRTFVLFAAGFFTSAFGQSIIDEIPEEPTQPELTTATFKSNRIVLGHSVESVKKGDLNFVVMHNFGPLSGGFYEFYGLDAANTAINFDYGVTDAINLGVGRSTFQKYFEMYGKIKLLSQSDKIPLTLSVLGANYVYGMKWPDGNPNYEFAHRLTYFTQLLAARKFNTYFSWQVAPFYLHKNLVKETTDASDIFGMSTGARLKLSKRVTLIGEISFVIPGQLPANSVNYSSLGMEFDTGGHIFQLRFSNTTSLYEPNVYTKSQNRWRDGDISFGFTINRRFTLAKHNS